MFQGKARFIGNIAKTVGGGICLKEGSNIFLNKGANINYYKNEAKVYGGGMYVCGRDTAIGNKEGQSNILSALQETQCHTKTIWLYLRVT